MTKTKKNNEPFLKHPKDIVIGVIDEERSAKKAVSELIKDGHSSRDILIFSGESGAQRIDFTGENHGLFAWMYRSFYKIFSDDQEVFDRLGQYVIDNHFVISAPATDEDSYQRVRQILKTNNGHFIHFFGRWTYLQLDK